MSDKIHFKIITHEKIVFEDDVEEFYVQTTEGRIGILKNHIPIICTLEIGVGKVIKDNVPSCFTVMGGILQFENNNAVILTDVAEMDCDIDETRARHAKQRAQERLEAKDESLDFSRAQIALSKAIARLNAVNNKHF